MALYEPRKDAIDFLENVFSDNNILNYDHFSYVEDFNIVLDQLMDTSGYLPENHMKCNRTND